MRVQTVECDGARGQFVKLKVLSGHSSESWVSIAELGIVGKH